jgi:hypothetical protein
MTDIGPAIRTATLADDYITERLSVWNGAPAVFTRSPVPEDAKFPLCKISPDVTYGDEDGLKSKRDVIVRDVIFYGRVAAPGDTDDHTRRVEAMAYHFRDVFHRNPRALFNDDFHVISINASGPRVAPTDDDSTVARVVTLTVRIQ